MFNKHVVVWVSALCTFLVTDSADYNVTVDPSNIITTVPDIYYGFTFDFWESTDPTYGQKWENAGILTVNLTNENLITLASAVSPAYLRIGGSPEDSIVYNVTGQVFTFIICHKFIFSNIFYKRKQPKLVIECLRIVVR